jgi:hypothetical protein
MRKRLNREERVAAALQLFVKQYARKAQKGSEPNDRRFDLKLQVRVRRMQSKDLDALLRHGEDEESS